MASHHAMASHHSMMAHDMAMAHTELVLRSSQYGQVLSDTHHRAVYMFAADHGSKSTCYGACANAWPPLLTHGAPHAGAGLNGTLIGTTKRSDGSLQVTYAGHPLYYFSGDKGTEIRCQHVKLNGGYWYVVRASGAADMAKATAMK
jgi:predicted lipoprotein with Yx(FWY)xxD motif